MFIKKYIYNWGGSNVKLYKVKPDSTDQLLLSEIDSIGFTKEKRLQNLIEDNISLTLGINFIASEFTVGKYRMDTIGYDTDVQSFIIIEYKKTSKYSVIDQGYAYLNTLVNHKADFVLAYNEKFNRTKRINEFDWSQVKVIFIAQSFDEYQKDAVNNPELPIDLYEAGWFTNNVLSLNKVEKTRSMQRTANNIIEKNITVPKSETAKIKDVKELKPIKESDLVSRGSDNVQEIYLKIKEVLLGWDTNFEIKPTKLYIGFRINQHNVVDLLPQKRKLKIWINLSKGELDDPEEMFRDVSNTGHWGNGDYELSISDDEQLEYILSLLKQSWRKRSLEAEA